MESVDLHVLNTSADWLATGKRAWLATVTQTWGSAPRPVGALAAFCEDGRLVGSVSGGCVEDDLMERVRTRTLARSLPEVAVYGVTSDEARRFRLPCGGTLKLLVEPITDTEWVAALIAAIERREVIARRVDLATGKTRLVPADVDQKLFSDEKTLITIHGPRWRLALIGASEVSRYLAEIGLALDYEVLVCDPREEYVASWDLPSMPVITAMADDFVAELKPDSRTIILALSHDPKHDDLALLEALKSDAFYVGAMGSKTTNAKRRERLALFDLSPAQIARLKGPVGLPVGSRTPPEIAVAILAELTAVRNGIELARAIAEPTASRAVAAR
ncbi:MAG: XdhC family protein [Burkholderiales bacterium]|nr:XdhC family protein [Burkholderiales bacterium]